MRKLLLATVATLGASMGVASYADAQVVDNTDGQTYPTPGQVTVRLNGRYRFYAGVTSNDGLRTDSLTAAAGTTATAASADTGTNRLSNYGFLSYARLYPGFDGVAANGLKYGASLEIRSDNGGGAGGGTYGGISASDRSRNELYFRREWGYIGTDKIGTFRFGNADGPLSLFLTGSGESFNDGAWNGDAPTFLPGNLELAFPFADTGNDYATTKAVYVSPQFYGVDFGVSFEPNTGTGSGTNGCSSGSNTQLTSNLIGPGNGVPSAGCDALASTSTSDYSRRRNTFEGVVRYRGTFGPIGVAATAGIMKSGRVLDASTPQRAQQYNDILLGDFGLSVTYAGVNLFGHLQHGQEGSSFALSPKNTNGTATEDQTAWTAGASYTIGPVIVGASYIDVGSPGAQGANNLANGGHQRREQGVAAGGTYSLAPGVSLFLSYLWDVRKQVGYNFLDGATQAVGATTPDAFLHNKVTGQVLSIGTSFAW